MEVRYTGRSSQLMIGGKSYVSKMDYDKNPKAHSGHFDKMNIGQEDMVALMESSNLHSFETTKGEDLAEKLTTPDAEPMNEVEKR